MWKKHAAAEYLSLVRWTTERIIWTHKNFLIFTFSKFNLLCKMYVHQDTKCSPRDRPMPMPKPFFIDQPSQAYCLPQNCFITSIFQLSLSVFPLLMNALTFLELIQMAISSKVCGSFQMQLGILSYFSKGPNSYRFQRESGTWSLLKVPLELPFIFSHVNTSWGFVPYVLICGSFCSLTPASII